MTVVYDKQRQPIRLGDEIGRGAEAAVYRVPEQPDLVAKIFDLDAPSRVEAKIAWMVGRPPENPTGTQGNAAIAWPQTLLYDRRHQFVGYLAPYVQNAVPLLRVFNPRLRTRTFPGFDWRYLHRTARNLAAAMAAVHARGYVVGDVHESNVMVTPSALVTLVDADSFQVRTADGTLFHCPMGKPEYTPPELQGRSFARVARTAEHDRFGLGVLIFQLLMEGSHPFRAMWMGRGDPLPLEERIQRGCFPYQANPPCPVAPPGNALSPDILHPLVSLLVTRCFVDGHVDPSKRPTPQEWQAAVDQAELALVPCSHGHYYSSHLGKCLRCYPRPAAQRRPVPIRSAVPQVRSAAAQRSPVSTRSAAPQAWSATPRAMPRAPLSPTPATTGLPTRGLARRLTSLSRTVWQHRRRWGVGILVLLGVCLVLITGRAVWKATPELSSRALLQSFSVDSIDEYPEEPIAVSNAVRVVPLQGGFRTQDVARVSWLSDSDLLTEASLRLGDSEPEGGHLLALSPDRSVLAAVGPDGTLRVWRVSDGHLLGVLDQQTDVVNSVALSPRLVGDGGTGITLLALGSAEGSVVLWRWEGSEHSIRTVLSGYSSAVTGMVYSEDGTLLAISTADNTVDTWQVSECFQPTDGPNECGTLLHVLEGHTDKLSSVVFSPDGTLLATGARDGKVRLWRVSDGALVHSLDDHRAQISSLAFSPDGTILGSGGVDGAVFLWRTEDGRPLTAMGAGRKGKSAVQSLAFAPNGLALAVQMVGGGVTLWGVSPDRMVLSPRLGVTDDIDTVVVLDASGSMDDQVLCYGCYDQASLGRYLPYNPIFCEPQQPVTMSKSGDSIPTILVAEAEYYSDSTSLAEHNYHYDQYVFPNTFWTLQRVQGSRASGYSSERGDMRGAHLMHGPDGLSVMHDSVSADAPRLDYEFDIPEAGDWYLWIRAQCGPRRDSRDEDNCLVHWGVDGVYLGSAVEEDRQTSNRNPGFDTRQSWMWMALPQAGDGQRQINLDKGKHTINIWGGSIGFSLDKLVLTLNSEGETSATDHAPSFIEDTTFSEWADVRRQPQESYQAYVHGGYYAGPPDTRGRTGLACSRCNPIYGLNVIGDEHSSGVCDNRNDDLFLEPQPLGIAKEAIRPFVNRMIDRGHQVGFVSYGTEVDLEYVSDLTHQGITVEVALDGTRAIGFSNASDGIRAAIEVLTDSGRPNAAKVIVWVSEGLANRWVGYNSGCRGESCCAEDLYQPNSGTYDEKAAADCVMFYANQANENGVIVYAIGLGAGADHGLLRAVAERTGGRYYYAPEPTAMKWIVDAIAEDLIGE